MGARVMFALLAARRFGPLFVTQFLGAFNDNLYKTAMLFLITFTLLRDDLRTGAMLVTLAGGIFILPYFLFSGIAGQLADARDKAMLIRIIKAVEIGIMLVGAAALHYDSILLLMLVLFAMGTHSAFFGPIKYAILPQHLKGSELLAGTGLVEAGTFIAILLGQVAGGLMKPDQSAFAVLVVAVLGYVAGRMVPPALPEPGRHAIDLNVWRGSRDAMQSIGHDIRLVRVTLAISWFWAMGAVLTAQFVPLVKGMLQAGEGVATLFLTMFSVGIALGSMLVNRLLKGRVALRFSPWAALAVSLFLVELYFAFRAFSPPPSDRLLTAAQFVTASGSARILVDLLLLSVAAGVFVVPLYAFLQAESEPGERARVIAANNIVNAGFIVVATLAGSALLGAGIEVSTIMLFVAALNLLAAALTMVDRGEIARA